MSPEPPSARELTRRLVARESAPGDAPNVAAANAHAACERVYQELSRWLGTNGCQALFTRALTQARAGHPALRDLRVGTGAEVALEGAHEVVQAHGAAAAAAGFEALLVTLLELLGRLIGLDMAARLVERSLPNDARDTGASHGDVQMTRAASEGERRDA